MPAARMLSLMTALLCLGLLAEACATKRLEQGPGLPQPGRSQKMPGADRRAPAPESVEPQAEPQSPRKLASLRLVEAAKALIEDGRPDEALRTLERAVSLNPDNGRAFFYMAEAWLMKDRPEEAEEYNHLAARHLGPEPPWPARIRDQAEQIRSWLAD